MKLEDYLDALKGKEKAPICLSLILKPFGFFYKSEPDPNLLTGLFLSCLTSEYNKEEWVDPIDIASMALTLGYEQAGYFLKEAPFLVGQAAKRGHISTSI